MTVSRVNTRRGRVLLLAGQGVVGGLGAVVDRVGDPARAPVAAQRQLIALTAFPGGCHRLGHQRQYPAAKPVSGLVTQLGDHRLNHSGLYDQAGLGGRPRHRQPQLGLAHRPDRERPGIQRRLQRRVRDEAAQVVRPYRRDDQRRRELVAARPGSWPPRAAPR